MGLLCYDIGIVSVIEKRDFTRDYAIHLKQPEILLGAIAKLHVHHSALQTTWHIISFALLLRKVWKADTHTNMTLSTQPLGQ